MSSSQSPVPETHSGSCRCGPGGLYPKVLAAGFSLSVARRPLEAHGADIRILLGVKVKTDLGVLFPVPLERTEADF